MNRNYIFVLTAIVVAIVIIGVVVLYQSSSMTLDQIIKNKDCAALDKWENDHIFDDNLNISSEQMSATMSLATECVGKVLGGMLGNSALSTDTTDPMVILDEILKKRDCEDIDEFVLSNPNLDIELLTPEVLKEIGSLSKECAGIEFENFLRESDLSTDTTDPMVVLGKILNKRDCVGIETWLKDYPEDYKNMKALILIGFLDFKYDECWKYFSP